MGYFIINHAVLEQYVDQNGDDLNIVIPEEAEIIKRNSFHSSVVQSIVIGPQVKVIEEGAFNLCYKIENIEVAEGNQNYSSVDGILFNQDKSILLSCPRKKSGKYEIPSSVKKIERDAFFVCRDLTEVTIPESVESMDRAFDGSGLVSVKIPKSIKIIEDYTFAYCKSLKTVILHDEIEKIRREAFTQCSAIESFYLPGSVKAMPAGVFDGWASLKEIIVSENNKKFSSQDGVLFNKQKTLLMKFPQSKSGEYIIPETVQTIGSNAFHYCSQLRKLTIPNTVEGIGKRSFLGCSSLQEIHILNTSFKVNFEEIGPCEIAKTINMLFQKDFSAKISLKNKHRMITAYYLASQDSTAEEYIKKNISKIILTLIDYDDSENIMKLLETGKFITKRNIEKLIAYSSQKERIEIYTILVNYKNHHFGFRETESLFKL